MERQVPGNIWEGESYADAPANTKYAKFSETFLSWPWMPVILGLLQEDVDGVDHPVCFFSKKIEKGQKNYCTSQQELLALVLALQHFDIYVSTGGYPITVYTDHNPLIFLHHLKNKNQSLLWCSILLQQYCLNIQHIKGRKNVIADALSRA